MANKLTRYDAYMLMHEGVLALARAERQGICIDMEYCERKKKHLTRKIAYYTKKVEASIFYSKWEKAQGRGKVNLESNNQLANMLYNIMGLKPPTETKKGKGSTDEEALSHLKVPELDWILKIRGLRKIRDTYLEAFIREARFGIIHPFYNLHIVKTYRSSSNAPNFQNIPKRDKVAMKTCRQALIPRPGHMFIEADFSSLEVSIGACYHKDPMMMKYLTTPGSDMHLDMAKQIFIFDDLDKSNPVHHDMRQSAKSNFVFPEQYGDYYGNCARNLCEDMKLPHSKWKKGVGIELSPGYTLGDHLIENNIKSYNDFLEHIRLIEYDFWNNRFRVYGQWKRAWQSRYEKKGSFQMYTGFTCSGIMKKNEMVNYPVQGAAFHCLLWSFIQVDRIQQKEGWDSRLIGQIHDSMLLDVLPEELEHVKEVIHKVTTVDLPKHWDWIIVPLKIDIDEYPVDHSWVQED